ncbi:MAG: LapA family protein [Gammaproteobacteria bacterium]|nr:MAG: LapA family protein [Gammaproteobacteria bacterium]RKZ90753.1 MAG: LapA family protein [Gammaproteobacteria bacterium]RKZ97423.1 MAG: LapA family protein [Gammaproteobacteria bacterium]RKZ98034.1 MAG: LapA family protein [Gammaproteobacteria bacterium]
MRRIMTIIIFVIVFAVGAAFSAINTNPVIINYYLGTLTAPLSVVMILSIVAGIILGAVAIFASTLRLRYENRRLNKKLNVSEQEINSLRIIPIKDEH